MTKPGVSGSQLLRKHALSEMSPCSDVSRLGKPFFKGHYIWATHVGRMELVFLPETTVLPHLSPTPPRAEGLAVKSLPHEANLGKTGREEDRGRPSVSQQPTAQCPCAPYLFLGLSWEGGL